VIRQGQGSSSGSAPQPAQMDPAMQQFFQTQMQLLANLANIVAGQQPPSATTVAGAHEQAQGVHEPSSASVHPCCRSAGC
jgi:hypothetical protein